MTVALQTTELVPPREEVTRRALHDVHSRGDRLMTVFLWAHFAIGLALAPFYDTWSMAVGVGLLATMMFVTCRKLVPGSFMTRCVAGVSLQVYVALHIYQLHGLAEMHFFFFTAFTAMLVYQDGFAMWPGTVLIIAQHIVFAMLHNSGVDLYFFDDPYVGVTKLFFHFGIAIVQVVLCNVFANVLRNRTVRDALARRELEVARNVAEQANEAKSRFLAMMSHEFRNPLHGIHGMSELLKATQLGDDQREQAESIHAASEALARLVDDVLDLSKVEAGKLDLDPAPMQLDDVIDHAVATLEPTFRARGVAIRVDFPTELRDQATVVGDRLRIRQVILNLVSNAMKFTAHGEVRVIVRQPEPGAWSIAVRDSGIGIPADALESVFEEYGQADGARTTTVFGGTGLGLPISRRLADQMNGSITVESAVGVGSTFTFTVPLPPTSESGQEATGFVTDAVPRGLRALVADDDRISRRVVELMLEQARCEVVSVDDGELAVAAVDGRDFDLILLDMRMPECGGIEAARRIRGMESDRGGLRQPIYALTGNAYDNDLEACTDAGMDGRLVKPLRQRDLMTLLSSLRHSDA